jgi:hypothetical protein
VEGYILTDFNGEMPRTGQLQDWEHRRARWDNIINKKKKVKGNRVKERGKEKVKRVKA